MIPYPQREILRHRRREHRDQRVKVNLKQSHLTLHDNNIEPILGLVIRVPVEQTTGSAVIHVTAIAIAIMTTSSTDRRPGQRRTKRSIATITTLLAEIGL